MRIRTEGKISLAVWAAVLFLVTIGAVASISTSQLVQDASWVAHSHEVRGQLQKQSRYLDAAKADIRGFLLTGDSAYLARHRANLDSTEAALRHAKALTADNPAQQARLAEITTLLADREAAFEATVSQKTERPLSTAYIAGRLAIGESLSARIDSAGRAADDAEQQLLVVRSLRQATAERFVEVTSAAIVLVAIILGLILRRSIKRDLAERTRTEAQLRASEEKFAGILAMAGDAIITADENQSILHFNHGAEHIFGYDAEDVVGKPVEMLLPSRNSAKHRAHIALFAREDATARKMGERRAVYGRKKNGTEFPAEASISRLLTPSGMIFTVVLRDVTEQQRREHRDHALAAAGARLAPFTGYDGVLATVAKLPVPAVGDWSMLDVVDEADNGDSIFRRFTSGHRDSSIDAALRERASAPLDWDSPDPVIDVFRTAEVQRIPVVTDDWLQAHVASPRELELARQIGMHSLLIVPLTVRERVIGAWTIGSPPGHVFDDHDVALAKELAVRAGLAIENARSIRRAQREAVARGQVLGVVSHDLRNPLSAVSMLSRSLIDKPPDARETRTIGRQILASAEWMHRLIEDLLDVASIDAGRLSVVTEPQSSGPILESVKDMFGQQAASKGLALDVEVPENAPLVLCDASRIVQVLGNLCANALKFTPSGGVVTVRVRQDGLDVTFSVRDSGEGIPPGDLPHIFDRFWHAERNSRKRGTGLGLAIAQGIVRAHGGKIWVQSTVGEGTEFFFTIPGVAPDVPFSMMPADIRETQPS